MVDGISKFSLHNTLSTWQNTRACRLFVATPQVEGIKKIRGAIIKEREELRGAVRTGDCPAWMTPALLQYVEEIDNEIIDNNGLKVVGPIETREILTQIHESPFDGGHLGAQKNLQKFRQYYIGHKDTAVAKDICDSCSHCQLCKDYKSAFIN